MISRVALIAALLILVPACSNQAQPVPVPVPAPVRLAAPPKPPPARAGFPQVPDDRLSPGAVAPDVPREVLCQAGYTEKTRHVTKTTKLQVYKEYRIGDPGGEDGAFEVDHRVPLEVNGSNDIRNLWPQSRETKPYNAALKDKLENKVRVQFCLGQITLGEAQAVFLGDWREGYRRYYGEPPR